MCMWRPNMLSRPSRLSTLACRPFREARRSCWVRRSETTSYLRDPRRDRELYLIGTAHVSQRSAEEVRELIHLVRPDHVAVELCPARAARLRQGDREADFLRSLTAAAGGHGGIGAFFAALNGLWKALGLVPGVDFKAALDAADAVQVQAHCIDRDVNETLRLLRGVLGEVSLPRLMTTTPPPELVGSTLGAGGLAEAVEALKDRRQVAALRRFLEDAAPPVVEVMLHQRDRLMARRLRQACPRGVAVAVVGLAHMDGVEREVLAQEDLAALPER